MKKHILILLAVFLCITGCGNTEKQLPTTVEFKNVSVKEAQQFVQGKWKVIQQSGGILGTTTEVTDRYIEFVGTTIWRTTNQNSTTDLNIVKWEKITSQSSFGEGIYLTIDGEISVKLENIHNDTLYYRDAVFDGYDYLAVRTKK